MTQSFTIIQSCTHFSDVGLITSSTLIFAASIFLLNGDECHHFRSLKSVSFDLVTHLQLHHQLSYYPAGNKVCRRQESGYMEDKIRSIKMSYLSEILIKVKIN